MFFDRIVKTLKKSNGLNTCEYIVLHHTGGGSFNGNVLLLSTGTRQVSCHYVIGQNGEAAKIGNDTDILWHAGESQWQGKKLLNSYSIGIEIINNGTNFTDKQRAKVRELLVYLMSEYNIPATNIIRHKDISPGRKVDVYDTFWNNQYKTFTEYQNSFILSKPKPPMKEAITLLIALNSYIHDNIDNEVIKDLTHKLNTELRKLTS